MNDRLQQLYLKMIAFDGGDPELIQHFTKVHAYASLIAAREAIDPRTRETLEAAALVHDIAIPLCREKYGSSAGPLQEREGPALARETLLPLGFDAEMVERVCWLVGHHHSCAHIDGVDHQILIEADFLVNAFEGNHSEEARRATLRDIFRTQTGRWIFQTMFRLD